MVLHGPTSKSNSACCWMTSIFTFKSVDESFLLLSATSSSKASRRSDRVADAFKRTEVDIFNLETIIIIIREDCNFQY